MTFSYSDGLAQGAIITASIIGIVLVILKSRINTLFKRYVDEAYNKGVEDMRAAYQVELKKRGDAIMKNAIKDSSITYDKPVTVATDGVCGNGHTRMQLDVDGVTFGGVLNEVSLRQNFEGGNIGLAKLSKVGNTIQAKIEVAVTVHNKAGQDLYPAIGGNVLKSHEVDGILFIDRFEITEVSLCSQPNADPAIQSIREQFSAQAVNQPD